MRQLFIKYLVKFIIYFFPKLMTTIIENEDKIIDKIQKLDKTQDNDTKGEI